MAPCQRSRQTPPLTPPIARRPGSSHRLCTVRAGTLDRDRGKSCTATRVRTAAAGEALNWAYLVWGPQTCRLGTPGNVTTKTVRKTITDNPVLGLIPDLQTQPLGPRGQGVQNWRCLGGFGFYFLAEVQFTYGVMRDLSVKFHDL